MMTYNRAIEKGYKPVRVFNTKLAATFDRNSRRASSQRFFTGVKFIVVRGQSQLSPTHRFAVMVKKG